MKKIYSIILLSLLIISCSDNNNNNILDIENPTINEVSTNTASSGDIIIIYGENFNPDENYIIKFNDIKGEIIEITTNSIKVQVPENATSGNITIIINLQIILVGDITIENTILFQKKHSRIRGVEHIIQTKDNNYVSIGGVNNSNIKLMTLTKYDEYGEIIWEKGYGENINNGSKSEDGYWVVETNDNGFILVGTTKSYGNANGYWDIYIVKTDSNGNKIWEKTYGGEKDDIAKSIIETIDNDYIVVGYTVDNNSWTSQKAYVFKINGNGDVIWEKKFNENIITDASRIIKTSDNNYLISGKTLISNNGTYYNSNQYDFLALKIDNDGNKIWSKNYGTDKYEQANDLILTSENDYVLVGTTSNDEYDNESKDIYFARIDENGNLIHSKSLIKSGRDVGNSITKTNDNNFFILGTTTEMNQGSWDMSLTKVDGYGNKIWEKTYGEVVLAPIKQENYSRFQKLIKRFVFSLKSGVCPGSIFPSV